ncbi:MFS transporter [Salinicoccus roseus]|uniref:Quinolone resistance protein NorB n=1 Tax=Salinicoccus roseus TaxID=45670 RepID=A0A265E536_9STAP|nr:MFS transporter [Salinicoccus roseus]OZT76699.1 MFS transporter [Salinicoccus roseus]
MNNEAGEVTKRSGNMIILGIVLAILTYWLFAQTFLNLGPHLQNTFNTSQGIINLSISLTSLITGIFMVAAGNLSDKLGKVRFTFIGIILSIVGSLMLIITGNAYIMLAGRVIQGFSAAMLMPATISILNSIFEGKARRSALSWWSIGAFGGTGFASFFGGAVSTYMGWQWIFIISIALSLLALFLLKELRHHTVTLPKGGLSFDYAGLALFTILMAALSVFITQGDTVGWLSPISLALIAVVLASAFVFYRVEKKKDKPFIDFSLFANRSYTGVASGNFLLNMSVGSIAVFNIYTQSNLGLTAFESGLVTLPYVILLLLLVRVGEKSIAKYGPKKALMAAPVLLSVGVVFLTLTFFDGLGFIISALIGFSFFGAGVGLFATPALDTAVSSLPSDKTGVASAIFKMASTLGQGFGIAILVSVYSLLNGLFGIEWAASGAFMVNIAIIITAFLFIKVFLPEKVDEIVE